LFGLRQAQQAKPFSRNEVFKIQNPHKGGINASSLQSGKLATFYRNNAPLSELGFCLAYAKLNKQSLFLVMKCLKYKTPIKGGINASFLQSGKLATSYRKNAPRVRIRVLFGLRQTQQAKPFSRNEVFKIQNPHKGGFVF